MAKLNIIMAKLNIIMAKLNVVLKLELVIQIYKFPVCFPILLFSPLTFSWIWLKNGQTYFNNFIVLTPQGF